MLKLTIHRFFILFGVLLCMIVAAVVISGCGRKADSISGSLLEIDAMLQTDPDSAYALLEKVNVDSLAGTRDVNFYRLLTVEAQDKTFRDDTVYKEICEAAEYFDSIGDSRNAMRSLFYSGRIFQNRHEYGKAIISMLKAEEKADTTEHLYLGKIYNAISESYKEVCDAPQELKYAQMALEEYEKLDSLPFVNDAKLWLGLSLCRNHRADEGIELMTKTYSEAVASDDEFIQIGALQNLSLGYLWNQDWQHAKNCLYLLNSTQNLPSSYQDLYLICLLLNNAPADSIENTANQIIYSLSLNKVPYQYFVYKGDFEESYSAVNRQLLENDSIFTKSINSNVALAVNTYLNEKNFHNKLKIKYLNKTIIWGILLSILLISIGILCVYIYVLRKRKREKEILYSLELIRKEKFEITTQINKVNEDNNNLIQENKLIGNNYKILSDENNILQQEILKYQGNKFNNGSYLLKRLFENLDLLHTDFYMHGNTEKGKNTLLNRISDQIKLLREDEKILKNIEDYVNETHDNILMDTYAVLKLNPEQRRIIALSCVNFSKESICQIMNITLPNYYTRMNRLIKRISGSSSPKKDDLMLLIHKKKQPK